MVMDGAMGDVLEVPWGGRVGGDMKDAGVGPALGFHPWVLRVDGGGAIDDKPVFMNAGRDGRDGDGPEVMGILGERDVLAELARGLDLGGLGGAKTEGDGAVGVEFGRLDRGRPLGARGLGGGLGFLCLEVGAGHDDGGEQQGELHGGIRAAGLGEGFIIAPWRAGGWGGYVRVPRG